MTVLQLGQAAKDAASKIAQANSGAKDTLLTTIAELIIKKSNSILLENQKDIELARSNGIGEVMTDRLTLTPERISAMADSLRNMAALPDPTGVILDGCTRPNGLRIIRKRVPIGVVAIIYESRPNVTLDAAALCLKAGNAVVLRGGKEAIFSNTALVNIIKDALETNGFPRDIVGLVTDTSRDSAKQLMELTGIIDLLIPRGGKELIDTVIRGAKVPVIETGAGNCHLYVDEFADIEMALAVTENAKMSRPSVCNAAETLLVHRNIADRFLPKFFDLIGPRAELRGDERARDILPAINVAVERDWFTEYNDYILAVAIVDCVEDAVWHINHYGTKHSEAIITEAVRPAEYFMENVDAAAVYLNASTRFTDGGEFGMSAEIGISTSKLHARGPMGLDALTTTKYFVFGDGQLR